MTTIPKSIITIDTLKTIAQGALGAMSFGIYHQFTSNKIMEMNNEQMEIQHKYSIDKMEIQHKTEFDEYKKEMYERFNKLEQRRFWW